jgi:alkanesulfonate monooxygenase SsuD/methylene tetrahydromethanopterin reductase-like flavin-dependent oxidoreductase (luciferase family)
MKVGVKIPPVRLTWTQLEELWRYAAGSPVFDSIWSFDHLLAPDVETDPCFECWTSVAVLAHHAPDKVIGHMVLSYNFRPAGLLAKMATVMDHATQGRFIVGLGAAWFARENELFDMPFNPSLPERLAELERTLVKLREVWGTTGLNAPPVLTPGGPKVWLGTQGPRLGLRMVARHADGWNFGGPDVATFVERKATLKRYCEEIGRDPAEIVLSVQVFVGPGEADVADSIDKARRFRDAGCDHLILVGDLGPGLPAMQRLAEGVAAPLRDA